MKNQKGFSLIELLIVVAIIGIIAAIAIPNLLASRRSANEGSAISTMRILTSAQATYRTSYGSGFYAHDLSDLGAKGIIDSTIGCAADPCSKSGFNMEIEADDAISQPYPVNWSGFATPVSATGPSATGGRSFYTNEIGVVYYKAGGAAPVAGLTVSVRAPTDGSVLGE